MQKRIENKPNLVWTSAGRHKLCIVWTTESTVDCLLCAQGNLVLVPGMNKRYPCALSQSSHTPERKFPLLSALFWSFVPFCFNVLFLGRTHKGFLFAAAYACFARSPPEADREYDAKKLKRHQKEDRIVTEPWIRDS